LGYVRISGDVVEPLIAASIVFVAVENIWARGVSRWRPFIIFGFGLLHGLGFASVLGEFGLPEAAFIPALIGFNIGVEVGQLAVIAVMFLCVWQALRVDRGENEAGQGFAVYGVLLFIVLAAGATNLPMLEAALENPVWLFAVPCSIAIAAVGAYWFVERVFL